MRYNNFFKFPLKSIWNNICWKEIKIEEEEKISRHFASITYQLMIRPLTQFLRFLDSVTSFELLASHFQEWQRVLWKIILTYTTYYFFLKK